MTAALSAGIPAPRGADPCYICDYRKGETTMKKGLFRTDGLLAIAVAAILVAACAGTAGAQGTPDYVAIVAAPDRSEADRTIDKRRDPTKLFPFTGVRIGMKVLDMGAGGGYSTEMMARGVGPNGIVYGQNAPDFGGRAKETFEARLKTPAMKNVVPTLRKYDDPLPAEVRDVDLITFFFFYHDVTYMPVDRAEMNRKLFAALKPGASLVIADHSAKPGERISVARTNHRIEEVFLRREIEAAGFKLAAEGNFLRQSEDPRDFNVNRPTGPVDEFVLRFEKAR
jgi:predicted methyltransferase